jgi:predicted nucleic acid-binding protein
MFDTDVLIWYLRGDQSARVLVKQNTPFSVSAVTYMELVQGMRNKNEFRSFQKQMRKWETEIVHIDPEISARAIFYVQEYALSHTMMMADALIAATAIRVGDTLCTANEKHYRFIPLLEYQIFQPDWADRRP